MTDETLRVISGIQPGSQMFVIACIALLLMVTLISAFGWIFTRVLNKQTDILVDMKNVITTQTEVDRTRISQNDKVLDLVLRNTQEMALHRQASEVTTRRTEIIEERKPM